MAETVRIAPEAYKRLKEIAEILGVSLTEALTRALELARRDLFFVALEEGYRQRTEEQRLEDEAEMRVWDQTLRDGLENE